MKVKDIQTYKINLLFVKYMEIFHIPLKPFLCKSGHRQQVMLLSPSLPDWCSCESKRDSVTSAIELVSTKVLMWQYYQASYTMIRLYTSISDSCCYDSYYLMNNNRVPATTCFTFISAQLAPLTDRKTARRTYIKTVLYSLNFPNCLTALAFQKISIMLCLKLYFRRMTIKALLLF